MAAEKMIKISKYTYERLKDYGKFRDTFDEVITRVLDENDRCKRRESLESFRSNLPKMPSAVELLKEKEDKPE